MMFDICSQVAEVDLNVLRARILLMTCVEPVDTSFSPSISMEGVGSSLSIYFSLITQLAAMETSTMSGL